MSGDCLLSYVYFGIHHYLPKTEFIKSKVSSEVLKTKIFSVAHLNTNAHPVYIEKRKLNFVFKIDFRCAFRPVVINKKYILLPAHLADSIRTATRLF